MNTMFSWVSARYKIPKIFVLNAGIIAGTVLADQPSKLSSEDFYQAYINYADYYGLCLSDRNPDADPDQDKLDNYSEFLLGTDPLCVDTDHDGFNDNIDVNPLSRAYIPWGDPAFTVANDVTYSWPNWMIAAYSVGQGDWVISPEGFGWQVSSNIIGQAALHVEVNRDLLTNNAVLSLTVTATPSAALYLDLYDDNEVIVGSNLGGNILADIGTNLTCIIGLPFAAYPDAAGFRLRRDSGQIYISDSIIYIDQKSCDFNIDKPVQIRSPIEAPCPNGYSSTFARKVASSVIAPRTTPSPKVFVQMSRNDLSSKKIIYVDKNIGNDLWTGRIPNAQITDGPKKTIDGAVASINENDTIVIRSGNYKETTHIPGSLNVRIEGNVQF